MMFDYSYPKSQAVHVSQGVEEAQDDSKDEGPVEYISYWKPNITINLVDDFTEYVVPFLLFSNDMLPLGFLTF